MIPKEQNPIGLVVTEILRDGWTDRQTDRQTDVQTDNMDRQTDRHTDGHTDKQTDTVLLCIIDTYIYSA